MVLIVTGSRSYHSPLRAEVAAATRERIMKAARELFTGRGYARVSVADIALRAGVAAKTVYASAGGKAEILSELITSSAENSGARETLAAVRRSRDLTEAMALIAHGTRIGNETNHDEIEMMRAAMSIHDDSLALWERGTTLYRATLTETARHLKESGFLATGLDVDRAADILWFCFGLAAWQTLTRECHWTWDESERWLAAQAVTMLAPPAS